MEQMRQQAEANAAAKASEEIQKKLSAAESEAKKATEAREKAEEQLQEMEKQLRISSPEMVRLGTYMEAMQDAFDKLMDVLGEIRRLDPETAEKLKAKVAEKLLDPMRREIEGV